MRKVNFFVLFFVVLSFFFLARDQSSYAIPPLPQEAMNPKDPVVQQEKASGNNSSLEVKYDNGPEQSPIKPSKKSMEYLELQEKYNDLLEATSKAQDKRISEAEEGYDALINKYERAKNQSFGLSVLVLVALIITLWLIQWPQSKVENRLSDGAQIRIFGLALIIFGSIYLVTAGFDKEQINPVLTIFGTVAGYLLAKETKPNKLSATESRLGIRPGAPSPPTIDSSLKNEPDTTTPLGVDEKSQKIIEGKS